MQAAPAQQHIEQEDTDRNEDRGQHGTRQIAVTRAVQTEARDRKPFDHDHEMGSVITQHPRQQQRISGKAVSRHQKGHHCTERRNKKAEALQGTALSQYGNRDQDHVDVAELQRQFPPPVEAAHVCRDHVEVAVKGEIILVEEKPDKGHAAGSYQNGPAGFFAFLPQEERGNNEQKEESGECDPEDLVERFHNQEILARAHRRPLLSRTE